MVSSLAPTPWDSQSALLAHLRACGSRTIVVGLNAEAPRTYSSFRVASDWGQGEIGVVGSGLGADTAAVYLDGGRRILVGHDTWVTWIDVEALSVLTTRRLGGVFFDFLPVDSDDDIVIVHELGAIRVCADGAMKWSLDTDVIEDSRVEANGNLVLSVMDGPRLVVSLASGAVSR